MGDEDLIWRVEQACFNAWPAPRQVHLGDWAVRGAGGATRRINSANPLQLRPKGLNSRLSDIEATYHRWSLPPRFRIPSFLPATVDARLAAEGYWVEGETLTLFAPMQMVGRTPDAETEVLTACPPAWLADLGRLREHSAETEAMFRAVLALVSLPAAYVRLFDEGEASAMALGVIDGGLLCLEAVVTDRAKRGRGHATRMLQTLFHWAQMQGAEAVCLQVQGDNDAGRALYGKLGLSRELYRYHYRTAPG